MRRFVIAGVTAVAIVSVTTFLLATTLTFHVAQYLTWRELGVKLELRAAAGAPLREAGAVRVAIKTLPAARRALQSPRVRSYFGVPSGMYCGGGGKPCAYSAWALFLSGKYACEWHNLGVGRCPTLVIVDAKERRVVAYSYSGPQGGGSTYFGP